MLSFAGNKHHLGQSRDWEATETPPARCAPCLGTEGEAGAEVGWDGTNGCSCPTDSTALPGQGERCSGPHNGPAFQTGILPLFFFLRYEMETVLTYSTGAVWCEDSSAGCRQKVLPVLCCQSASFGPNIQSCLQAWPTVPEEPPLSW